jgi:uncharacterized protein YbjQ (UPF0145 family)
MPARFPLRLTLAGLALGAVSGCATWSHGSVERTEPQAAAVRAPTSPAKITLTEADITNRRYTALGDITVTVNKTTVFHADPTREHVNEKLRERAAELGADAVILVRYGKTGVGLMSWGSLEGKGRAIKFQP